MKKQILDILNQYLLPIEDLSDNGSRGMGIFNYNFETIAKEILDLLNLEDSLPDCPLCGTQMNVIVPKYCCPKCHTGITF
jgi:hypothetical protein